MKTQRTSSSTKVWLSARDTYQWAHRPEACWPGSTLSGRTVFAEYDNNGDLVDFAVDGESSDVDENEFRALVLDFARN